ncbi:MAG TPA: lipocalin family protein [Chitinophaga sp.]|nr:lipocalin family protein [Chitinophaga sp.]
MKRCIVPAVIFLLVAAACQQPAERSATSATEDSSLIDVDTVPSVVVDSVTTVKADTITYDESMLVGKWLQPVPGVEKEMQGFQLKKNGGITSINTYSLVYSKWKLMHDTLLLWSRTEGAKQKDSSLAIDTILIRALTDSSLILFPIKAAEGYTEEYRKVKKK